MLELRALGKRASFDGDRVGNPCFGEPSGLYISIETTRY